MKKFLAILLGAIVLWGLIALVSLGCGSNSYSSSPGRTGECDTTRIGGQWKTTIIECVKTDTLYVTVTDTLWIAPDYECFGDCIEIQGLGHWEECIRACIPALQ